MPLCQFGQGYDEAGEGTYSGHILAGELVGGVRDQKTRLECERPEGEKANR